MPSSSPDSTAAIAQLEALRRRGASHFLIPFKSLWLFRHLPAFKEYVEAHYPAVVEEAKVCCVYDLSAKPRIPDAGLAVHNAELAFVPNPKQAFPMRRTFG